ncbi:HTH-type transcriptional regulator CueR [compost metagenome]
MDSVITYSISDLAREFGITTRTIRFYEEQDMLAPVRRGQERVYSSRDRVSLKLILRGKRIGFALSECSELIGMYDPSNGNRKQLQCFLEKIEDRRRLLERQMLDVQQMQAELDAVEERCYAALVGKQGSAVTPETHRSNK